MSSVFSTGVRPVVYAPTMNDVNTLLHLQLDEFPLNRILLRSCRESRHGTGSSRLDSSPGQGRKLAVRKSSSLRLIFSQSLDDDDNLRIGCQCEQNSGILDPFDELVLTVNNLVDNLFRIDDDQYRLVPFPEREVQGHESFADGVPSGLDMPFYFDDSRDGRVILRREDNLGETLCEAGFDLWQSASDRRRG